MSLSTSFQSTAVMTLCASALCACSSRPTETDEHASSSAAGLSISGRASTNIPVSDTVYMPIKTGVSSTFYVKTLPKATCTLHGSDPLSNMTVLADDEGTVTLHATATSDGVETMALDCVGEDGSQLSHPIETTASSDATVLASAKTTALLTRPAFVGTRRPALEGDPLSYDAEDLVARGYGWRPDPQTEPQHYQAWARAVATPTIRVPDRRVPLPNVKHGGWPSIGCSPNWAGWVSNLPSSSSWPGSFFNEVGASWIVPVLTHDWAQAGPSDSSPWVGMGGWNLNQAIWQAGLDDNNLTSPDGSVVYQNDNPWAEQYPEDSMGVPNFSASAGQTVAVWVWSCFGNGQPWVASSGTAVNPYVCIWMYNYDNGNEFYPNAVTGGAGVYNANQVNYPTDTAEVIVERIQWPLIGGWMDYANFGTMFFPQPEVCMVTNGQYYAGGCRAPWEAPSGGGNAAILTRNGTCDYGLGGTDVQLGWASNNNYYIPADTLAVEWQGFN